MKMKNIDQVGKLHTKEENLDIYLRKFKDGLLRIYFTKEGNGPPPIKKQISRDRNSIGFRLWHKENEIILLGITIKKELRGQKMSFKLLDAFLSIVDEFSFKFNETGLINKPIQAKILKKYGFTPKENKVLVEILPKSQTNNDVIPKVQIIKQEKELIKKFNNNIFYEEVSANNVLMKYPLTTPESIVELHTKFYPPLIHKKNTNQRLEIFKEKFWKILNS